MEEDIQNKKEGNTPSFMVPGAIIVAGVFIAGAIFASNSSGNTPRLSGGSANTKETLGTELYSDIAKKFRLNAKEFTACITENRYEERVQSDYDDALASGGTGTPYNIVINARGEMFPFSGALDYGQLKTIVTDALQNNETFSNNKSKTAEAMRPLDENDHVRGNPDAPITIVEYSDLQCPFCKSHHPTLIKISEEFSGQVKWVYRHFPLTSIHAEAFPAAVASECAAELGGEEAFWGFIDQVFERT